MHVVSVGGLRLSLVVCGFAVLLSGRLARCYLVLGG